MLKLIFKTLWSRRRRNGWLLAELIVVCIVSWVIFDPVVVVTSDFHTLRAQAIARRQGWQQVQAVGAPTPLYLRYNAWLREYFALASSRLLGEM